MRLGTVLLGFVPQSLGTPESENRSVVEKAGGAVKDAIEGVGAGIGRGLQRLFGN